MTHACVRALGPPLIPLIRQHVMPAQFAPAATAREEMHPYDRRPLFDATAECGLVEEVAALAGRLAAKHLGNYPAVTAVLVEPADGRNWFIAGKRPTDAGFVSFLVRHQDHRGDEHQN